MSKKRNVQIPKSAHPSTPRLAEDRRVYKEVGKRIKKERKEVGITVRQFAEALGKSDPSVDRYEAGKQAISIGLLYRMCDILRCTPATLCPPANQFTRE